MPTHSYGATSSNVVTLTVTDDRGDSNSFSSVVSVVDPPAHALDRFEREVVGGFGTAERGGDWTGTDPAGAYVVTGGRGSMQGAAGAGRSAYLESVAQADHDVALDLSLDRAPSGGGAYVSVIARRVSNGNDYRALVRYLPNGSVTLTLVRTVNGGSTTLASTTVPDLLVAPGESVRVRLQVTGTASTTVRAKVWRVGTAEPIAWALTNTAATPAVLQAAGHLGVFLYLSGSWSGPGGVLSLDNLTDGDPSGNVAPFVLFSATVDNLEVSFDTSASSDPDGTIVSYEWDFGDGTTGTGPTPSHSYATDGVYAVTLTLTDEDGTRRAPRLSRCSRHLRPTSRPPRRSP